MEIIKNWKGDEGYFGDDNRWRPIKENKMEKNLYFCVGCRTVHYDRDYCERDGDLLIHDLKALLLSIYEHKEEFRPKKLFNIEFGADDLDE